MITGPPRSVAWDGKRVTRGLLSSAHRRIVMVRPSCEGWEASMVMRKGQVFRCQNPNCRAEIRVEKDSIEVVANPRCGCGAEMKKPYAAPALRRLEPRPELIALLERKS
jgi:hypothetical protein